MKKKLLTLLCGLCACVSAWAQFDTLTFSVPGGFYDEVFPLELQNANPQYHIRYTTNGNEPTRFSPLYSEPLVLDERMYSTSGIYRLCNCPVDLFRAPDSVDRCIVVRAAVFDENDSCVSPILTNSYFIGALGCDLHGLPAASLCVDSSALFDFDYGIFVEGANYNPERPHWSGNYYEYGREWERRANFEFYELDNEGVNQHCGVRTHGGNGRRFQQKTLKMYSRKKYGKTRFEHRFFPNLEEQSFKILILRPFQSANAGIEDYLCNRLAQQMDLDFMADRPCVLFLNGEYWGIYYVKERPDEHYIEDHYGIDSREVNLHWRWFGEVENGSPDRFNTLFEWMKDADLNDAAQYAHADSLIDIDNFINYYILEMFVANFDWPVNNVRFWQAGDSKFRWMFYDGDPAFEFLDYDVFAKAIYDGDEKYPSSWESTLFFRKFLESSVFQEKFAKRFNEAIASTFSIENTQALFDGITTDLMEEAKRQFIRFGRPASYYPLTYHEWTESHLKPTLNFLKERPKHNFLTMNHPAILNIECYPVCGHTSLRVEADSFGSNLIEIFDLEGNKVFSQVCVLATGSNCIPFCWEAPHGAYLLKMGDTVQRIFN